MLCCMQPRLSCFRQRPESSDSSRDASWQEEQGAQGSTCKSSRRACTQSMTRPPVCKDRTSRWRTLHDLQQPLGGRQIVCGTQPTKVTTEGPAMVSCSSQAQQPGTTQESKFTSPLCPHCVQCRFPTPCACANCTGGKQAFGSSDRSHPAGGPDFSKTKYTCSSSGRLMSMSGSPNSPQGSDSRRRDTIWDTSTGRLVASPDSVNSSRCCTQHQRISDEGHIVKARCV